MTKSFAAQRRWSFLLSLQAPSPGGPVTSSLRPIRSGGTLARRRCRGARADSRRLTFETWARSFDSSNKRALSADMNYPGPHATVSTGAKGGPRVVAAGNSNAPAVPAAAAVAIAGCKDRDFVRVGRSKIEGIGVFAKRRIHRGARIIEYVGERVESARLLLPAGAGDDQRIYSFRLNDTVVIDGARGGNESRFINHSCAPNCEAYAFDDRMYIYALTDIVRGEELTFDYKLAPLRGWHEKGAIDEHACRCGAPNCRGTMRRIARKS